MRTINKLLATAATASLIAAAMLTGCAGDGNENGEETTSNLSISKAINDVVNSNARNANQNAHAHDADVAGTVAKQKVLDSIEISSAPEKLVGTSWRYVGWYQDGKKASEADIDPYLFDTYDESLLVSFHPDGQMRLMKGDGHYEGTMSASDLTQGVFQLSFSHEGIPMEYKAAFAKGDAGQDVLYLILPGDVTAVMCEKIE